MKKASSLRVLVTATIAAISLCSATVAWGHGHPITVTTDASDRLIVGGGVLSNTNGYANEVYVETDSAGDPQDFGDFSNFGTAVYWIVPGFEISGLAENSGLYLEPLARPVRGTNPVESRTLWYWNPNSTAQDKVSLAPPDSKLQLRHSPSEYSLLTPTTYDAPPAIKFAAPLAADENFHNHDLMRYLMPYPLPDEGAYAFFARLTSDVYGPSDPFLVVINNGGLEGDDMLAAAAAINHDALLAGDYNHDDKVDAADYALWRRTYGSSTQLAADGSGDSVVNAADYLIWRDNLGLTYPAAAGLGSGAVPEPTSAMLFVVGMFSLSRIRARGRHSGRG